MGSCGYILPWGCKQAREIHRLERTGVGAQCRGRVSCAPVALIGDSPPPSPLHLTEKKGYEKCSASGICAMTRAPYQTPRPSCEIGGKTGEGMRSWLPMKKTCVPQSLAIVYQGV